MSTKVRANIGCPQCSQQSTVELCRSIWIENPANKALILDDAINVVTCPRCGFQQRLDFPFLATNAKRGLALWYEPYHDEQIDRDAAAYAKQFGPHNFLAKAPRIADWQVFKRTLLEMEATAPQKPTPAGLPLDVRQATVRTPVPKSKTATGTASTRRPWLSWLWGRIVRRPVEVTQTVEALARIQPIFIAKHPSASHAVDRAFSEALATAVAESALTIHSIRDDKWQPRDLALLLVSKASSRALASGQHHVYRGILRDEARGYLAVFQTSVEELARSGFITPQDAQTDLAAVKMSIKENG